MERLPNEEPVSADGESHRRFGPLNTRVRSD